MTSLPCSVLPRTLNIVLLVLAWATIPTWVLAFAGIWLFDDNGSTFATMGAAVCSFALFAAFFAGRVDKFAIEPAEEREQALIEVVDRLSGAATPPSHSLRAVQ